MSQSLKRPNSIFSFCPTIARLADRESCCVHIDIPINKPDLAIYSQEEIHSHHRGPSWDNPDIELLNRAGVIEPTVTIRNLSSTVSAVNALVHFSISEFGIGMARTPVAAQRVSLAPAQELRVTFPLSSEMSLPNPFGAHVEIDHPQDANPLNHRGSDMVTRVRSSVSGRNFALHFPISNQSSEPEEIFLPVSAHYMLGHLHDGIIRLASHERREMILNATVPEPLHGTPDAPINGVITVMAVSADNELIDGLTFLVTIDN